GRAPGLSQTRRTVAAASVPVLRRVERDVLRHARKLYATSAASRDDIAAAAKRNDVRVLPIPVDTRRFAPASEWPPGRPVVAFVGRGNDPRKNVGLLIEGARRLPDVHVLLAGVVPNESLPPNVEALGTVDDVAAVLRRATIFVLPSRQEGFGIA